jgi:hypothetical protein
MKREHGLTVSSQRLYDFSYFKYERNFRYLAENWMYPTFGTSSKYS